MNDPKNKLDELREAVDHHLPRDGSEPQDIDLNTGVWALEELRALLDLIASDPQTDGKMTALYDAWEAGRASREAAARVTWEEGREAREAAAEARAAAARDAARDAQYDLRRRPW